MYLKKSVKLPQYKCQVTFFVVDSIPKKVKMLEKKYSSKAENYNYGESSGLHFAFDNEDYFILVRSDSIKTYYITHEVVHFGEAMVVDRGIGEEEKAYLTGYLNEEIKKFLETKKIKI